MPTSLSVPTAIKRMERAFDLLVNFEDAHNQNKWRQTSGTSSCGTALCFAGWAAWDSPYEYVVNDLVAFVKSTEISEDEEDDYFDGEGLLYSVVAIPPGDVLQQSALARDNVDHFFKYIGGKTYEQFTELASRFPEGTKFMSAPDLAAELLHTDATPDPHVYWSEERPILSEPLISHSIYNYANSLSRIRDYIDEARAKAGMAPRNFKRAPVKVRTDDSTPQALVPILEQRVATFNKRATEDGFIQPPGIATPEELLPPLEVTA